ITVAVWRETPMSQAQPSHTARVSTVDYAAAIRNAERDPQRLEDLYQSARSASASQDFVDALLSRYREVPESVLYAASYYRLQHAGQDQRHGGRTLAHWRVAVPLSILLGLTLWLLSDPRWTVVAGVPAILLLISPVTALFIIAFLTLAARRNYLRSALVSGGLLAVTVYVLILTSSSAGALTYLTLMLLHVPLLSALAVGLVLLGLRASAREHFLFLTKSIEVIGTAGIAVIAGGVFVGLTYGVFEALSVEIPEVLVRLLIAGGAGLIPVLAVATVYDPT